jgi:8-oxo-dGTP diphosphatase
MSTPSSTDQHTHSPKQPEAVAVACLVLLDQQGAVLTTRRPEGKQLGGLWEFPGGKVEARESPEEALRREIWEELELSLGELEAMSPVVHEYPFGVIRLLPFLSRIVRPSLIRLVEHSEHRWVTPQTWGSLEWAPADLPVLDQLTARLDRARK